MVRGEAFRKMEERKLGVNLELLEPASPGIPVAPNHAAFGIAGLAAGLILGVTRTSWPAKASEARLS